MTSTPTISINSPPTSSRPSLDSSTAPSRLSSDSQRSLASLPSQAGTPVAGGSIRIRQQAPTQRRNRSALREFYGLKRREDESPAGLSSVTSAPSSTVGLGVEFGDGEGSILSSELDNVSFDAQEYVDKLVASEGLRGLLKVENGLINDIRGYDGERKSLVYDNYNKLIAATDTIRNMRSNMDPLTPATITLSPAISHIASVSTSLVEIVPHDPATTENLEKLREHKRKQDTVRWVALAPERMRKLIERGKREEAIKEWQVAKENIARWKNVKGDGVKELLKRGEEVLAKG